jgi:two-component system LytT family sensor kinase
MIDNYLPYIVTELFCLLLSLIILFRLRNGLGSEKEVLTLRTLFIVFIIFLLTDILWALNEDNIFYPPVIINLFINAVANLSVTFGCYYWYCFTEERLHFPFSDNIIAKIISKIPLAIMCILNITSVFTGLLFYIDENDHYQMTSLIDIAFYCNILYFAFPAVYSIFCLLLKHSKKKSKEYLANILFVIMPVMCTYLEDLIPTVPLLALIVLTALLILFLTIFVDREKEILKKQGELEQSRAAILQKEQELAQSRMSIMLSQIQPHFLYNTLAAIQAMCHDKAPDAEESISQFSQFLRGNLDSLSQLNPIPFRNELNHTMNYLNLEVKRFGSDILNIVYNIEAEDFRIPALTLQPIVENAVRYGVMQRESGGTVLISSLETEKAFVVTVKDDGVGFDVSAPKPDGRTHIGISNVRNRLEKICNGSLTITSVRDVGTTAVLTIPKSDL